MTVKPNESRESVVVASEFQRSEIDSSVVVAGEKKADRSVSVLKSNNKLIMQSEAEMEQESGESSSEEVESPRSVSRWRRRRRNNNNKNNKTEKELIHSQILRIREEDSHLGEDYGESRVAPLSSTLNVVVFSRPILPCSPLGGKTTTVKALH